jgi:hypothetical protein
MEEMSHYYAVCFLEDINFSKLIFTKAKLNFNRRVYYDPENKIYLKIWDREYVFCPYFLNAVKKHFYEDIALVRCIIFDRQDFCRGYITLALNEYKQYNNYLKESKNKLLDVSQQNENFKAFLETLKKKF